MDALFKRIKQKINKGINELTKQDINELLWAPAGAPSARARESPRIACIAMGRNPFVAEVRTFANIHSNGSIRVKGR